MNKKKVQFFIEELVFLLLILGSNYRSENNLITNPVGSFLFLIFLLLIIYVLHRLLVDSGKWYERKETEFSKKEKLVWFGFIVILFLILYISDFKNYMVAKIGIIILWIFKSVRDYRINFLLNN